MILRRSSARAAAAWALTLLLCWTRADTTSSFSGVLLGRYHGNGGGLDRCGSRGSGSSGRGSVCVTMGRRASDLPPAPGNDARTINGSSVGGRRRGAGRSRQMRKRVPPDGGDSPRGGADTALGSTLESRGGGSFIGAPTSEDESMLQRRQQQRTAALGAKSKTAAIRAATVLTVAVAAVEIIARLSGHTSTILVPPILNPALDRTAALLSLLFGPLFTALFSVSTWSAIAPFASIGLKLSPMPTILSVQKRKSTGGLPLLPYSAMTVMTFVLVVYGILVRDVKIACTHGVGHLISLFYCTTFVRNLDQQNTYSLPGRAVQHGQVGLTIVTALLTAVAILGRGASTIAGMTSVVLSCVMYAGPLAVLQDAVRQKSARAIPVPYAVASFVNAVAWTVYGYFGRNDFMVWAPGFVGLLSSTAQIVMNVVYGNGVGDDEGELKKKRT